ncbi:hypothetical protein [Brevibacterium album]|uniref:hypothetical protein n=1 Tax=Brevibacterium album TaxID=417948 RepID=UPI00041C26BA|nr:hypothetical protein [Brevibacterium album]
MTGREHEEEPERPEELPAEDRVADADWQDFVDSIRMTTARGSEIAPEEVREALDDEDWTPPEPAPVGWRTASPALVLGFVGALGGLAALLLGALFLRPFPGWAMLVLLAVTIASAAVLFTRLPRVRDPGAEGGEV